MGHRPEAPRPSRWGCPLGLLLASSSLSLLALLLLPTPTAAVGAAAASTFVVSKPAGGLESSGGSSSSSSSDPEIDSAEPASSSLASALLPSSAPPSSKSKATQLHLVEVYENERWTALGGWQRPHGEGKVRPWTYEDGGESLDPQRLRLPDGFEWCGPWRILRTNGTDAKGWQYANRALNFDSHNSGHRQRTVSDRARRRRWVRPMRRAAVGVEGQGGEAAGVKQLRSVLLQGEIDGGLGGGAVQDGGTASGVAGKGGGVGDALLLLLLGEEDLEGAELLAPPERVDSAASAAAAMVEGGPLGGLLVLGHAVQQAVTRARQDFCFKGFGLTFTKSLVGRAFGVGFGVPLTPNFPAWERVECLPTINSCVGVFFPFTISGWCSISYPADMVFRVLAKLAPHIPSPASAASASNDNDARYRSAATRAAAVAMADARRGLAATATAARARAEAATKGLRMAAAAAKGSNSQQKKGGRRRRRGSVERVGISISCRYNPSTGFFVRVTPWLFILPGLQLLARLLARLFNFVLGRVEELESRTARRPRASTSTATATAEAQARQEEEEEEEKKKKMQQEQEQEEQRALLASASARRFKKWLSKKTSGLGYTMALYKSGLGASVLVSLSPFFFGLRRPPSVANLASATALGTAQLLMDGPEDAATTAPSAAAVESIVVEGPVSEPLMQPPLATAAAAADGAGPVEAGQGEDEIPVPVLANGQEEEEIGEGGGGGSEPLGSDDKDRDAAAGAGGGGDGATPQPDGGAASSSSSASAQPDTEGDGGGGLNDQGAGVNTIGVA